MTTFAGYTVSTRRMTHRVAEANNVFEISFECVTTSETEITNLKTLMGPLQKTRLLSGKISIQGSGTKGSLVFNGTTYTNCYIESLTVGEVIGSKMGLLNYTISFVKDTSI